MKMSMGIIKVEIKVPELVKAVEVFKENNHKMFEVISSEIKSSISDFLNNLLEAEMDIFLGTPDQSNNKKNGTYEREFSLKGVGCIRLRMPRDRMNSFSSSLVPKSESMDKRLKEDLALLHLAGISNRTMALISKRILGVEVSAQTVHNSLGLLEEKSLKWLDRPITKNYKFLFIDGTNFRVTRRGSTEKEPTLVVMGLDDRNCYSILSLQAGQKDSAESWGQVFRDLINRGLDPKAVELGIMDGLPGLEKEFKRYFNCAQTARCWVHAKRNALLKAPKRLADALEMLINKVMYANSEVDARRAFGSLKQHMQTDAERSVNCLEKDLESLLVHYKFEQKLWRTLRTTNPIERINKELKRRFKSMEHVGEKTQNVLLAFTAMRLEYNWQTNSVDNKKLNNLKQIKEISNQNQIDDVLENLIH